MAGSKFTFGFRSKIGSKFTFGYRSKKKVRKVGLNILSMVDEHTIKLKIKPSGMILHGVNMKGFVRDKKGGV